MDACLDGRPALEPLGEEVYGELLELLLRGASVHGAFVQLGLPVGELAARVERDGRIQELLAAARQVLSFNVLSALYQKAMKGSVPAQLFWLTHAPPPGWTIRKLTAADLEHLDPDLLAAKMAEACDAMPDDELARLAGDPAAFELAAPGL